MNNSTKIWLAIAGILLVALGIVCLFKPAETLFATTWLIGCMTLLTGLSKLVFSLKTQSFLPNSATRLLSGLLLIILGIIILVQKRFVTASLPVIFSMWIIFEGVMIAVQSFDYKKIGFRIWWLILILGIIAAAFGFLGLRNLSLSATTLSRLIGIGVIMMGVSYLIALCGIKKFEKQVGKV